MTSIQSLCPRQAFFCGFVFYRIRPRLASAKLKASGALTCQARPVCEKRTNRPIFQGTEKSFCENHRLSDFPVRLLGLLWPAPGLFDGAGVLGRCAHKNRRSRIIRSRAFVCCIGEAQATARGLCGPPHHITDGGAGWPSICSRSVATAWSSPVLRRSIRRLADARIMVSRLTSFASVSF